MGTWAEGLPTARWYYWGRLLFRPLVVWWALYAAAVIDLLLRPSVRPEEPRPKPRLKVSQPAAEIQLVKSAE